jgi:hypothetical protein
LELFLELLLLLLPVDLEMGGILKFFGLFLLLLVFLEAFFAIRCCTVVGYSKDDSRMGDGRSW